MPRFCVPESDDVLEILHEPDGWACYWNDQVVEPRFLDLDIIRRLGPVFADVVCFLGDHGVAVGSYVPGDAHQRAMLGRRNDARGWR